MIKHLSASQLSIASPEESGCLRKWYYKYVMRLPEVRPEKTIQAQFAGTLHHKALELYATDGNKEHLTPLASLAVEHIREPKTTLVEHSLEGYTLAGIPIIGYIDSFYEDSACPEVLDFKTTGNKQYAKTPTMLAETIQMSLYGHYAVTRCNAPQVRLSHLYLITKPNKPEVLPLRSIVVSREKLIEKHLQHEAIAATIIDASNATSPDNVAPCLASCGAYGGCGYRHVCPEGKKTPKNQEGIKFMRLLDKYKTPPPPAFVVDSPAEIKAEKFDSEPVTIVTDATRVGDKLLNKEYEAEMVDFDKALKALGENRPRLVDEASDSFCKLINSPPIARVEGVGNLVDTEVRTRKQLIAIAYEVAANAPAVETPTKAEPVAPLIEEVKAKKVKTAKEPLGGIAQPLSASLPKTAPVEEVVETKVNNYKPTVMVNVITSPPVGDAVWYADWVAALTKQICSALVIEEVPDLRLSNAASMGFGKWKAVLSTAVQNTPITWPALVMRRGDEVADLVLNALRSRKDVVIIEGV